MRGILLKYQATKFQALCGGFTLELTMEIGSIFKRNRTIRSWIKKANLEGCEETAQGGCN